LNCQAWTQKDAIAGIRWARMQCMALTLLPLAAACLYALMGGKKRGWVFTCALIGSMYLAVGLYLPGIAPEIAAHPLGFAPRLGPWFFEYGFFAISAIVAMAALLASPDPQIPATHRARLPLLGFALATIATTGFQASAACLTLSMSQAASLYPVSNLAVLGLGSIVAYAVIQHEFLSVHAALSRLAAQLLRIFAVFLAGFLLTALIFLTVPEQHQLVGTLLALLATAVLATLLLPRLMVKSEQALESRLLGGRYEYQDRMRNFIETIPFYHTAEALLIDLQSMLLQMLGVKGFHLFLQDDARHSFLLIRSHPPSPEGLRPALAPDSPIFAFFQSSHAANLACNPAFADPLEPELERNARAALHPFNPEHCFLLAADETPIGLLLVMEKTSGEPLTHTDLMLLTQTSRNLGLVLHQMRLKRQLMLAEEMELLGTMSRGIAHDLNNLLTPITTFMQLASSDTHRSAWEELLPTAMRNLEAIRTYVRESVFFSRTKGLQVKSFAMDRAIHDGLELVRAVLKEKNLAASIQSPENVLVEMDEVLFHRLLANLLSNAIEASPEGGSLQVHLEKLFPPSAQCGWVRLRVIDSGEGISRANIHRVTNPDFTTKTANNRRRGFGLGLAICRKIVHLHGGHLTIASEEHKGTHVQVDLPERQIAALRTELPIGA
jgi:signal transduction histidine kinase